MTAHGDATHYNEMNVLSMHALLGAYSDEGQAWTEKLLQVLEGNCKYADKHIWDLCQGVFAAMPQGTYMLLSCFVQGKRLADGAGHLKTLLEHGTINKIAG